MPWSEENLKLLVDLTAAIVDKKPTVFQCELVLMAVVQSYNAGARSTATSTTTRTKPESEWGRV